MPTKVTWEKGMRLSPEIFDAMDASRLEALRHALLAGTGGRCGLFASPKPFDLSVNVSGNTLEVVALSCHGVTRSGRLVDIDFDSNYAHTFDTRISIPPVGDDSEALLLLVRLSDGHWRKVNEIYSEASYSFELVGENTLIGDDCLPVGCVVNQYGWRLNETDFVPPCLTVNAHGKYVEQTARARSLVEEILTKVQTANDCIASRFLGAMWPAALAAASRLDKERNTLTPAQLFSIVQQLVGAFLIGCTLDEYVSLEDALPFSMYAQRAYNAKSLYRDIELGLSLTAEVAIKTEKVCTITATIPEPTVETPAPKPKPEPAPAAKPKRGWEGRVI